VVLVAAGGGVRQRQQLAAAVSGVSVIKITEKQVKVLIFPLKQYFSMYTKCITVARHTLTRKHVYKIQ
jgi:hypothetical protein